VIAIARQRTRRDGGSVEIDRSGHSPEVLQIGHVYRGQDPAPRAQDHRGRVVFAGVAALTFAGFDARAL
jgi:hypothetical protein